MSSSSATKAPIAAAFVCDCGLRAGSACEGLPFFKVYEEKRYCVLHYPGKDKSTDFNEVLKRKLDNEDVNFIGVWFPDEVDFSGFQFTHGMVFDSATFSADTYFNRATFGAPASFIFATFNAGAYFDSATFSKGAYFRNATFNAVTDFSAATVSDIVDFSYATFKDYVIFAGKAKNPSLEHLKLEFARIEKPDRLSFHTHTLRPQWFVNVDARKFEFINVNWDWRIRFLRWRDDWSGYRLTAIACRNLAVNAEENHRYEEASLFRYLAMNLRRLGRRGGYAFWTLGWWYWLASGYGERVCRAFVVLVGVWLLAAGLYTQVGFVRWEPRVSNEQEAWEARRDEVGQPLRWQRALTYSLGVMTLQKPEPRPATDAAQALVMLETILGPVQAALLALAIRRKFMR